MLSYRHGFHAGFWADVHKHTALAILLARLRRKPAPFCVVDPFAGDGVYDLSAPAAQKTGEFHDGIARIWQRPDAPAGLGWYLDNVRAMNPGGRLTVYPGSPALARAALRDDDRLILAELHSTAHANLKRWAKDDARLAVHRRDGYELLGALTPPPARRGLVLVDPSYEVKTEYETLPAALARALARWPQGVYAVWYPVLAEGRHTAMVEALARLDARAVLQDEIAPTVRPAMGMRASGLVVFNPPWQCDQELAAVGDWLARALWPPAGGRHRLAWLKPPEERGPA